MDPCTSKSKWNSQQIQKQCKNNRHNSGWSKSKSNASRKWTNLCNEYHKNIYTQYDSEHDVDIMDEPQYWRCTVCTYDNIERDLYCSICRSPFQSSYDDTNASHGSNITLSDYIAPQCTDNIHNGDDFDEDIQIAIILSYHQQQQTYTHYVETDSDDSDICTHFDTKQPLKTSTKPLLNGYKPRKAGRQKRKFQTKKEWQAYKQKEKRRAAKETKALKKHHRKCLSVCPRLLNLLKGSTKKGITEEIFRSYPRAQFDINMECVLNYNVVRRFVEKGIKDRFDIVYHGTDYVNNKSIIAKGLVVGGTKNVHIRNGSAYGRGVYCSPDISTARCYENGSLFVCVVKKKRVERYRSIWVVPEDNNILPLFLASFEDKTQAAAVRAVPTANNVNNHSNQKIIKFIPSFTSNKKKKKVRRKWNPHFKSN